MLSLLKQKNNINFINKEIFCNNNYLYDTKKVSYNIEKISVLASNNFILYLRTQHALAFMMRITYKAIKYSNRKRMKPPRKELFSSHRLSLPIILPRSRRIDRVQLKFKFLITILFEAANSTSLMNESSRNEEISSLGTSGSARLTGDSSTIAIATAELARNGPTISISLACRDHRLIRDP